MSLRCVILQNDFLFSIAQSVSVALQFKLPFSAGGEQCHYFFRSVGVHAKRRAIHFELRTAGAKRQGRQKRSRNLQSQLCNNLHGLASVTSNLFVKNLTHRQYLYFAAFFASEAVDFEKRIAREFEANEIT